MTRHVLILLLLSFLIGCDTKKDFTEPQKNYFLKYYGKEGDQIGVDLVTNQDGSFYILGTSEVKVAESKGTGLGKQIYIAKADEFGNVVWEYTYGSIRDEEAKDLEVTSSGNLLILASETQLSGDVDIKLYQLDNAGIKKDSVTYGISSGVSDYPIAVTEVQQGYVVAGYKDRDNTKTATDALHILFDANLDPVPNNIFTQSYGQGTINCAVKALKATKYPVIIIGYTNALNAGDTNNSLNYWYYPINSFGVPGNDFKIPSPLFDEIASSVCLVQPAAGSGYLVSGISTDASLVKNLFMVRLTQDLTFSLSDIQFERKLDDDMGNIPNLKVMAYSSIASGFLVLSSVEAINSPPDIYLTKLDNRGQKLWDQPIVLGGEGPDMGAAISELPDGKIMILGTMTLGGVTGQQKIVMMKLNSGGKLGE